MTLYALPEVGLYPTKHGTCPGCGKKATRSVRIAQTLNPLHRNANGTVKTREQVLDEVRAKCTEWKATDTWHAKCEPRRGDAR